MVSEYVESIIEQTTVKINKAFIAFLVISYSYAKLFKKYSYSVFIAVFKNFKSSTLSLDAFSF